MKKETALKTIAWIALAGVLFSGYLSYTEILQGTCALGTCSTTILSIPPCVYGLVMYIVVLVVSLLGINSKK